ncbi:hypothetical protein QFZ23_003679 [Arthrobacter globiformis]|nr:hypothetical protein [Arthrobacter globiformis]
MSTQTGMQRARGTQSSAWPHVDADMVPEVGGKAANLGVLLAAGLPAPRGFCVTTAAYRRVAAAAGVEPSEPAEQTRSRLASASLPGDIVEAILAAYADLGGSTPVAVRSSATRRGSPRSQLRRPAGHVPQCRRPRRAVGCGPPLLGLPVDGPGRGLPRRSRD